MFSGQAKISKFLTVALSTFFYVGYLPFIPGTFGSLAGILLFCLIKGSVLGTVALAFFLLISGFLLAGEAEKIINQKDARCIVIDEVSGMLLSLMFVPYDLKLVALAFLLFRILDSLKPYPAGLLQELRGSAGIMSDDIIAGLYTNIIIQLVLKLASFNAV